MALDMKFFEEMEARIPKGKVRTRFAPSPTGYMHVGNLRTALYTWLMVALRISPDEVLPAAAGLFVFLSPDWCAILSRRCIQACGMQNPWWLGTCSALSCLAPLGALNFLHNINLYLQ